MEILDLSKQYSLDSRSSAHAVREAAMKKLALSKRYSLRSRCSTRVIGEDAIRFQDGISGAMRQALI